MIDDSDANFQHPRLELISKRIKELLPEALKYKKYPSKVELAERKLSGKLLCCGKDKHVDNGTMYGMCFNEIVDCLLEAGLDVTPQEEKVLDQYVLYIALNSSEFARRNF